MITRDVYVISLRRRPMRIQGFFDRWAKTVHHEVEPVVFGAVDLPRSTEGCFASHRAIWQGLRREPAVIFEDDACFTDDFTLDLTPPSNWQILWLGGEHTRPPLPYDGTWVRPQRMIRTHAYIVRDSSTVAKLMADAPAIDPHLSLIDVPQYCLRRHTVGQAGGYISERTHRIGLQDQYWQPFPDNAYDL